MDRPKTITEVCRSLDISSRTVRYYEQLGLISTLRDFRTAPRRLDEENVTRLKKILFLRKLSLSLDEIGEVIDSEEKAKQLISSKRAELSGEITALTERIYLLEEVLAAVDHGEDIFSLENRLDQPPDDAGSLKIAAQCAELLVEQRFEELRKYMNSEIGSFSSELLREVWDRHIKPCGKFIALAGQSFEGRTTVTRLHFEKLDVLINIDVCGGLAASLFFRYLKE